MDGYIYIYMYRNNHNVLNLWPTEYTFIDKNYMQYNVRTYLCEGHMS